jgi:copper chaperone
MQQQFTVTGMTCGHCEMAVKRAIQQIDGGAQVEIDRAQNLVRIQSVQPREAIAAAIKEEGYVVVDQASVLS